MDEYLNIILPCLSAVCTLVGLIVAYVKGTNKKKAVNALTEKEQKDMLYSYMLEEAKKAQRKSKFFQPTMSKQEVANEKRESVMEKVTMYARGANFTWYDENEWNEKLTKLLSDAKELQK